MQQLWPRGVRDQACRAQRRCWLAPDLLYINHKTHELAEVKHAHLQVAPSSCKHCIDFFHLLPAHLCFNDYAYADPLAPAAAVA
jgi:hypothetical protein